jgi:hypothetical protein
LRELAQGQAWRFQDDVQVASIRARLSGFGSGSRSTAGLVEVGEELMALGIYISPASMTAAQYDEIFARLDAAGAGHPKGRLYHSCFGTGDELQIFDIWESQEDFDKFGVALMPILSELGLDPGRPTVEPVHNLIPG